MTAKSKRLKKLLKERLPEDKLGQGPVVTEGEIDTDVLSKVVARMKEKYEREGTDKKLMTSRAGAMRERIEYGPAAMRIKRGTPKDLMLFENTYVRGFAKFYDVLRAPLSMFSGMIDKFFGAQIQRNLTASGMRYSTSQYFSLLSAVTMVMFLLTLFITATLVFAFNLSILLAVLLLLLTPVFCIAFGILIPSSRAQRKAVEIDRHLPFALRHMAIEIKAGVGIFKVMESVAGADYGAVSEGFKYVLFSIEKGVPTEEALQNWAARTRSDSLKRSIFHLVRALRTGGNLSDIMVTIAEDVSFEHRMKISEFAGKLNLMSLFLLMVAIVFPVMFTILAAIGSSPQIKSFVPMFTMFSPSFLILLYFIFCPALIMIFIMFVRSSDPG